MKPRVILAALDEYTRPAGLGPGLLTRSAR